jgi:hypothetical protein
MRNVTLFNYAAIPAAATYLSEVSRAPAGGFTLLTLQSKFTRSSGGTTLKAYLQTSLDDGTTWVDVACHAFATTTASKASAINRGIAPASQAFAPSDGSLADDTIVEGALGDRVRVKLIVNNGAGAAITSSSAATERVTTTGAHGLTTGDRVLIEGHTGSTPNLNGLHVVTVFDADEFSLDDVADITVGGTGGTFKNVYVGTYRADIVLN